METYPTGEGRRGVPNIQQLLADRARLTALRTAAVKMMTEEHVAAIITPSRDSGNGGGTGNHLRPITAPTSPGTHR